MKDPSTNIAVVLKKVRFERGLTLEDTSNLTGV
ncbi:MAG TPA: DNA-binding protein, partial [Tissierella sp.]|nr:DNA-binding protein [Tissierella sp.]